MALHQSKVFYDPERASPGDTDSDSRSYGPSHQPHILRYCFCDRSLCLEADATDIATETGAVEEQRIRKTKDSINSTRTLTLLCKARNARKLTRMNPI